MAEITSEGSEIPTEVQSKLCSKACLETVKKYRGHTQGMCDNLKRLEQDRREYVLIVANFEDQIKAYQANELQHEYDLNYWKWEKKEFESNVEKVEKELEEVKSELGKAHLDIEKYSNASKAMDTLLKAQIHDKLKRGIGYNTTPPSYNNNYIPPTTDLLEKHVDEELPKGSIKVDPLDEVAVEEDESESEETDLRNNQKQENIPQENQILINEDGGHKFIGSKRVGSPRKKEKIKPSKKKKKVQGQTTVVNPCTRQQQKPNKSLKSGEIKETEIISSLRSMELI